MKDKELRSILERAGVINEAHNGYRYLTLSEKTTLIKGGLVNQIHTHEKDILEIKDKLNAILEILNIEEINHKTKGLKKGNKEIEY